MLAHMQGQSEGLDEVIRYITTLVHHIPHLMVHNALFNGLSETYPNHET